MSTLGLVLVLTAAVCHATWNYFMKRVGQGAPFVWAVSVVSAIIFAPLAIGLIVWQRPHVGAIELFFMFASAAIHVAYFLSLQKGFRVGDFSVVYPIARGTGPVLTAVMAIVLLQESPSLLAIAGIGMVALGAVTLSAGKGGSGDRADGSPSGGTRLGVLYGLLTGVLISSYTVLDKYAVSAILIPPLLLDWASHLGRTLILAPWVVGRWPEVQAAWRDVRFELVAIGVLSPLAYILVLTAMTFTPVSYVAPVREVSILIGTVIGSRLLAEGDTTRRMAGACAIVAGVVALALG